MQLQKKTLKINKNAYIEAGETRDDTTFLQSVLVPIPSFFFANQVPCSPASFYSSVPSPLPTFLAHVPYLSYLHLELFFSLSILVPFPFSSRLPPHSLPVFPFHSPRPRRRAHHVATIMADNIGRTSHASSNPKPRITSLPFSSLSPPFPS